MKVSSLIRNLMTSRAHWLSKLLDPRREIDRECGHPEVIEISDYSKMYRRGDVAARVVSLYPDEAWSEDPLIYETEEDEVTAFETAWNDLIEQVPLFPNLHRADVLSGIGRFGVLLIGIDDGLSLDQSVPTINDKGELVGGGEFHLIYLRPLDESVVKISSIEADVTNPRYGLPTTYEINFVDSNLGIGMETTQRSIKVHWSRIIHLADNRLNSEVFGMPRLEKVFNRILDLKKIAGGSGEMFWKGGFPGLSMETQPTSGDEEITIDKEATKEQMEAYMNGLQRYLATEGLTARSLTVQVADPTPHMTLQLKLISVAMSVPWRVFVGSEAAQLASEQDIRSWNRRLNRRREEYLSPYVVRPFVERLILMGILPMPKAGFIVDWGDLNGMSDKEQADVGKIQTEAMSKYAQSGLDTLIPPFLYFTLVLGMSDKEAKAIVVQGGIVAKQDTGDEPLPPKEKPSVEK